MVNGFTYHPDFLTVVETDHLLQSIAATLIGGRNVLRI